MELVGLDVVLALALVFVVFLVLGVEQRLFLLYKWDCWTLLGIFYPFFPLFQQLQPALVLSLNPGADDFLMA